MLIFKVGGRIMSRIVKIPVVIRGYVVSYDPDEDIADMERDVQFTCTPVARGNTMIDVTMEITGPTEITCCHFPKVRGGKCENCDTWVNDS
jgi:hypothetical protein